MPKGRSPFYAMPCCGVALSNDGGLAAGGRCGALAGDTSAVLVVGTRGYHLDAFLSPVRDAYARLSVLGDGQSRTKS